MVGAVVGLAVGASTSPVAGAESTRKSPASVTPRVPASRLRLAHLEQVGQPREAEVMGETVPLGRLSWRMEAKVVRRQPLPPQVAREAQIQSTRMEALRVLQRHTQRSRAAAAVRVRTVLEVLAVLPTPAALKVALGEAEVRVGVARESPRI